MAVRRAWLWLLAWALVAAPTLGHVHRTLHGPQAAWSQGAQHDAHHGPQTRGDHAHEGHDHAAPSALESLFTGHDDESSCRLYDQLSHSDVLPALPLVALPLVLTPFVLRRIDGAARARWAALFDARGPPVLR